MPPAPPAPLSDAERAAVGGVLAQSWGLRPRAPVGLLAGGYLNRTYLLRAGRQRYVLRRYDYNTAAETIAYEHRLLAALPARVGDAAIPRPLPAVGGETLVAAGAHYYGLFPFLDGAPFDGANPRLLAGAGHILALYHNAVRDYTPQPPQRPRFRSALDLGWVVLATPDLPAFWAAQAALPARDAREVRIHAALGWLQDEYAHLRYTVGPATYARLPHLVIHNDLGPHNLLSRGDQVIGLLDFDLAAWDARVYDLATSLVLFSEDPALVPPYPVLRGDRPWALDVARARAVCRAYRAALDPPLTPDELATLPWGMRMYALLIVIWYLNLRLAGRPWYPEEVSGLITCLGWFRDRADRYVATLLAAPRPL